MAAYFAEDNRGSIDDIEAVRQVLIGVIRSCQQQKHSQPLSYINGRLDPLFFDQLPKGMKTGIEAARHNTVRKDPVVMDEVSVPVQQNRTERKEPVVTSPENVAETSKKTTRKEPIVSFDDVDVETKKPG